MARIPIPSNGNLSVNEKDIVDAINRIDDWKDQEIEYSQILEGITNPNWLVKVGGKKYFVKVPGKGTEVFIDRKNVRLANTIAERVNVGPAAPYFFEDTGVEVFEWLDGYITQTWWDVLVAERFFACVDAMKAYHSYTDITLPNKQSLIDQCNDMIRLTGERGGYFNPDHEKIMWLLNRIEEAAFANGMESKPCHMDTLIYNFMWNEDIQDMKMIDFEYAAMSDPMFDLAVFSVDEFMSEEQDRAMIERYYGYLDEVKFARMKLFKIVSDIKWGYWACVQAMNSTLGFDFIRYHGWKMSRLRSHWSDPRVEYWIRLLHGRPIFAPGAAFVDYDKRRRSSLQTDQEPEPQPA